MIPEHPLADGRRHWHAVSQHFLKTLSIILHRSAGLRTGHLRANPGDQLDISGGTRRTIGSVKKRAISNPVSSGRKALWKSQPFPSKFLLTRAVHKDLLRSLLAPFRVTQDPAAERFSASLETPFFYGKECHVQCNQAPPERDCHGTFVRAAYKHQRCLANIDWNHRLTRSGDFPCEQNSLIYPPT